MASLPSNPRARPTIMLWKPKTPENIGHSLRCCRCYDANLIVVAPRCPMEKARTKRRYRSVATHASNYPFTTLSEDAALLYLRANSAISVEITSTSTSLVTFDHPSTGVYVFGPEEGSVPATIIHEHGSVVQIPSVGCLNLAAAVAVVLYDRAAKL